jgi:hypothetical protein
MTRIHYLEGMTTVDDVIQSYVTSKLIESLNRGDQLAPEEITEYDARVARFEAGETKASSAEELDDKIQQILQR